MTSNYRARRRRTAPPRRSLVFARASTKDDESAFYCSVCSGWFVASEPRVDGDDRAAEAPGGGDARAAPAQKAVPTPREIYAGLEEHVVGQHNVKMALSVAVHNHYKRLHVAKAREAFVAAADAAGARGAPAGARCQRGGGGPGAFSMAATASSSRRSNSAR